MQDHIFEECHKAYLNAKPGETFWSELADKFGFESGEKLRKKVQKEREKRGLPNKGEAYVNKDGGLEPINYIDKISKEEDDESGESSITMNFPEGTADILKAIFDRQNKDEKDLLNFHGFDVEVWTIKNGRSNAWNMPSGDGEKIICFQTKISVVLRSSAKITFEDIDNFFSKYVFNKKHRILKPKNYSMDGEVLEIDFADFHIGNRAFYDGGIEVKEKAIHVTRDIVARCKGRKFSKIYLILLGDMLHFDTKSKTTTGGTQLDNDGSTQSEIYDKAIELFITIIDIFASIAPIEIISINGNHDYSTSYMFASNLDAYFRDNVNITFDKSHMPRKYRLIGNTLVGFAHGDGISAKNMRTWLQVEARKEWGKAKWSELHIGHVHHQKGEEGGGIIQRYVSSITDTDRWHYEKGFIGARKGVMSFVWGLENGFREIWFSSVD